MATAAAGILVIVVIIMYLDNIVVHSSQQKAPTVQELETWHDHYVNEETLNIYHSSTRGRCWFSLAASIVHACTIDALFMLIQHLNQTCITLQRISSYCCHHCRWMKPDLQYATVMLTNGNCSSWHSSNSGYQYVSR